MGQEAEGEEFSGESVRAASELGLIHTPVAQGVILFLGTFLTNLVMPEGSLEVSLGAGERVPGS